ncbi:hypothetical protein AALB53_04945 [Lachnospiraceae bacterium 47-T17]
MTAGEHDSDSSLDTQAPDFGQVPFFCLFLFVPVPTGWVMKLKRFPNLFFMPWAMPYPDSPATRHHATFVHFKTEDTGAFVCKNGETQTVPCIEICNKL